MVVATSSKRSPGAVSARPSMPSGSETDCPNIWYPPHSPRTLPPRRTCAARSMCQPCARKNASSESVAFVPGMTTRSHGGSACPGGTIRTLISGSARKGSEPVPISIRAALMTAPWQIEGCSEHAPTSSPLGTTGRRRGTSGANRSQAPAATRDTKWHLYPCVARAEPVCRGGATSPARRSHQNSIPRCARIPASNACFTGRISVTVSATSSSLAWAPRPVMAMCRSSGLLFKHSTTSSTESWS